MRLIAALLGCAAEAPEALSPPAPPPTIDATIAVWPSTATIPANVAAFALRADAGFDPVAFNAEVLAEDGASLLVGARLEARVLF